MEKFKAADIKKTQLQKSLATQAPERNNCYVVMMTGLLTDFSCMRGPGARGERTHVLHLNAGGIKDHHLQEREFRAERGDMGMYELVSEISAIF